MSRREARRRKSAAPTADTITEICDEDMVKCRLQQTVGEPLSEGQKTGTTTGRACPPMRR